MVMDLLFESICKSTLHIAVKLEWMSSETETQSRALFKGAMPHLFAHAQIAQLDQPSHAAPTPRSKNEDLAGTTMTSQSVCMTMLPTGMTKIAWLHYRAAYGRAL